MSRLNRQQLNELSEKWLKGTITPEEKMLLQTWYNTESDRPVDWSKDASEQALFERLSADFKKRQRRLLPARPLWPKWVAAAAILILISVGSLYFIGKRADDRVPELVKDIGPGGNRATLTLANGRTIDLSTRKSGIVIGEDSATYNDGSPLIAFGKGILNLSTPKGGQYQIELSDGTKIWLNAASTLSYPSRFSGGAREVEITGEAYFEVAANQEVPFKVFSRGQEIQVLGTTFNVQAYADESMTTTTLIEGKVRVQALSEGAVSSSNTNQAERNARSQEILSPGQEAVLSKDDIQVRPADVASAIAWKHGLFRYNQARLDEIMRNLARWYQVEVVYDDESLKEETFVGVVSRYNNISDVLAVFEEVGNVRFTVKGNTVVVHKKE